MAEAINPDYDPTGIEGGVDTNVLRWMAVPGARGMHLKPLRASTESGMFSVVVKLDAGAGLVSSTCLGGMDLFVLSGEVLYEEGGAESTLEPGTWGYLPANTRIARMVGQGDAELLVNSYSALAWLGSDDSVSSVLTSADVRRLAEEHDITLVPNTLAECMRDRPDPFSGDGEPLAIASRNASQLVVGVREGSKGESRLRHSHFVDTREVPWVVNPDLPDIGLKILRVSAETGIVSLVVRHNGVADPHNHLGASDFLVLSGRIGYRAGPPDGYGPGVWFFEPAGARHDATQRLTDDDLIYMANVYGPLTFDSGRGTPIAAVLSWMEYDALSKAAAGA